VRLYHEPSQLTVKYGLTRSRETNRWFARRELAEKILERDHAIASKRRQEQERVRRQKRRRSRRQKAKILADKRQHSEKKAARRRVSEVSD
jgi:protein subunit release factor B